MIFWCRRWMLHSRSNRATVWPWVSASTWTSMWRGSRTYRSRNTVPSPKAASASRRALATASRRLTGPPTVRMPRPPPPADALTSRGQPSASTSSSPGSSSPSTVTEGSVGTPAARISSFDPTLDPMASMAAGGGPIQWNPAPTTTRAKSPDSDRKP